MASWGSWKELTRVMPWRVWWSQEIGLGEAASAGDVGLCRVICDFDHLIGFLVSGGLMLLLCARKLLVNLCVPTYWL